MVANNLAFTQGDMPSEDVFEHYKVAAASSGRKKDNKRTRGERSKIASKKARTEDPPATVPSKENTPPPSPLEKPASTPPVNQHSTPPTPVDRHRTPQDPTSQTQRTQPEGSLFSIVVSSARERIYKLSKHKRSQEAIDRTISMETDQILNRGLNEIVSGLLTMTAGWRRAGAMVSQTKIFDTRLAEAKKALEGKNTDLLEKNIELTKQNDELLEKSVELSKQNEELLEQKATLTEELLESRGALKKSNEDKEKFRESAKLNYQQSQQLELNLITSRHETEELEKRMKELEELEAKNMENRKANFSYLSECLRRTLMSQCAIRLEEEERANVPTSLEISLATWIDGADNEAGAAVDQDAPQDPPTS
ncbi:uncharacterized protein LOC133815865 [Humulus lupulus]|uniref:uncharacterized protein LOC133815865 n=1 Tax=Humulus lupulus TaxID=3486 RepID=UPI002B40B633|nr:uncharacterized protein LOC133815865 [Humulus lupulus]